MMGKEERADIVGWDQSRLSRRHDIAPMMCGSSYCFFNAYLFVLVELTIGKQSRGLSPIAKEGGGAPEHRGSYLRCDLRTRAPRVGPPLFPTVARSAALARMFSGAQ